MMKPEKIRIIAPDGHERCETTAYYVDSSFIIEDMKADMEPGDELRRILPNGKDGAYHIDDSKLIDAVRIVKHYHVHFSRKGTFTHNSDGYIIAVNGANSRVNIGSTDNSSNFTHSDSVFGDMQQAIEKGVADPIKRAEILAAIKEAEKAKGSGDFIAAYQKLVGIAADHIGLIGPFLPALSVLLS